MGHLKIISPLHLAEEAKRRQQRIESLMEDAATPDGRCPNGQHNVNGNCISLAQIKANAHAIGKAAHTSDQPEHHAAAARAMFKASKIHAGQGFHQDAHALKQAGHDHAIMARHQSKLDPSQPCPPGMTRTKHGHCAPPHEITGHADGLTKIADVHSKHASMHGGSANHQMASRGHAAASQGHADAARALGPLAQQDPNIHKLLQGHQKKAAEHGQKARQHSALAARDATNQDPNGNYASPTGTSPRDGARPEVPDQPPVQAPRPFRAPQPEPVAPPRAPVPRARAAF